VAPAAGPIDWSDVDVAVFDVDGTLYDQRRLRLHMLGELLVACARARSPELALTLREYRRVRERLAERPDAPFMLRQFVLTGERRRRAPEAIERLVAEWIDMRPLRFLRRCRYSGLDRLFAALRGAGKTIAIFSDYPAREKLAALGLHADVFASACDADVGRLKPHPAGLLKILRATGAAPERCLMIGDRADRDGAAARQVGMRALIRARRPQAPFETFGSYADETFQTLLDGDPRTSADRAVPPERPAAQPAPRRRP
jgi:phosphoglycolate phosphatase/putative hydrolase of the HAD superfamily